MAEEVQSQKSITNKTFFKNIAIVIISNLFSAVAGILIGFIIPKILSVNDYGYYKTFTLYSTYIGLLHFGFIDGIYLKFAGQSYEELDKEKFRTYTRFLMLMETAFTVTLLGVSFFFLKTSTFFVLLFVALNIFLTNMSSYFEFIDQVTMRFTRRSIRKVLLSLLNITSVVVLYLLWTYKNISISGLLYIEITCLISALILLWYIFTYRKIIFGRGAKFKEEKGNIISFFKVGILLLFATLVSQFIFAVDQQFVNIFFDTETYASYAFAYNMINVILIATSAISVVFFPTIKKLSKENLISQYNSINAFFLMFVAFCLVAYFPVDIIVRTFLSKYESSLLIFTIVFPGAVISSSITSIKYNCYKAFNHIKSFFFIALIVLAVSIGADTAVYFIFKDPKYIAIASIVCLLGWYIACELFFRRMYRTKFLINFLYLITILGAFYGIYFIGNIYIELGVYFGAYLIITYAFHFKLINRSIKNFIEKRKNKSAPKEEENKIEEPEEVAPIASDDSSTNN